MTHTVDIEKLIYFDLARDGSKTSTDDVELRDNDNAVIESIDNIITGRPRTKIYNNREHGANLDQFLFEPIDVITANDILEVLETNIGINEPRVHDLFIDIEPKPDENKYSINIKFFIDQSDRQIELQRTLEKVR